MDVVVRAALVYLFLLLLVRCSGRRTLASLTAFDLILTLILSECVQNAIVGDDYSLTTGFLAVVTLVMIDILLSLIKQRFPVVEKYLDGVPTFLVQNGTLCKAPMDKERVDSEEILKAARELHGLERLEQVKHAVLERDGHITIIPRTEAAK